MVNSKLALKLSAFRNRSSKSMPAYVSLAMVLFLLAFVTIAISILFLQVISFGGNVLSQQGNIFARHAADSCIEIAIDQLLVSNNYPAGTTYAIGPAQCTVVSISSGTAGGNANRTIIASGTFNNSTVRVQTVVDILLPSVIISAWDYIP